MHVKAASFLALGISLLVAMVTISAFTALIAFAPSPPHLTLENMIAGKAHHLLLARETWTRFPAAPWPAQAFISWRAAGFMLVLTLSLLAAARHWRVRWDHPLVAFGCMLIASVPYGIGWLVLSTNTIPERAGPWLATMLLSVLYGCIACAVIASMRLLTSWQIVAALKARSAPRAI